MNQYHAKQIININSIRVSEIKKNQKQRKKKKKKKKKK